MDEPRGLKPNEDYAKQVKELTDFVNESKAYLKGNRTNKNLIYEAIYIKINILPMTLQ